MSAWVKNIANWIAPAQTKKKTEPFSLFCNCEKCATRTQTKTTAKEPQPVSSSFK